MKSDLLINREKIHFLFDKDQPPAVRIDSGSIVRLETERADCMILSKKKESFKNRAEVLESRPNPITGPVFVQGAEVGDFLKVSILREYTLPGWFFRVHYVCAWSLHSNSTFFFA